MYIKTWNNWDMGVCRVNPNIKQIVKYVDEKISPKERKQLKKISREFWEELGLEFVHNLKPGWENKLLNNGTVLSKGGNQKLKTKEDVNSELAINGQVQFHHRRKNNSLNFIAKEVKRPAHLCWG